LAFCIFCSNASTCERLFLKLSKSSRTARTGGGTGVGVKVGVSVGRGEGEAVGVHVEVGEGVAVLVGDALGVTEGATVGSAVGGDWQAASASAMTINIHRAGNDNPRVMRAIKTASLCG
jgi:hypothetical protein